MLEGMNTDVSQLMARQQQDLQIDPQKASNASSDKLKDTTQEFESLFIKMMLDAMHETLNPKEGLLYGGKGEEIFKDMLNTEYAQQMAREGSFGIADTMYDEFSQKQRNAAYGE